MRHGTALADLAHVDPREAPLYTAEELALFVGVHVNTLKYWLIGTKNEPAPIEAPGTRFEGRRFSFNNLLEAHILLATSKRDIPLRRLRRAIRYLREESPGPHPLLSHDFYSAEGRRDVFLKAIQSDDPINASRHGQIAFGSILNEYLRRIEWDREGPVRLFPIRTNRIVLDVYVSGGQPVVKGTGILARMLLGRHRAGETVDELASDYRLKPTDVEEALRYIEAA